MIQSTSLGIVGQALKESDNPEEKKYAEEGTSTFFFCIRPLQAFSHGLLKYCFCETDLSRVPRDLVSPSGTFDETKTKNSA